MKSRLVLVDTSAWIALFLDDDEWHGAATTVFEALKRDGRLLVTTSDIFDETATALRRWSGHKAAVRVGRQLRLSRLTQIVSVTDPARERAWTRFEKTADPPVSLTDCTSMVVMDDLKVREVFTFDDDFRRAGYQPLPRTRK